MSNPGGQIFYTEQFLTSREPIISDIRGRPTLHIGDSLGITQAFDEDTGAGFPYALAEHWLLPTDDLLEKILADPVDGKPLSQEKIRGLESARWLGHKAMDNMASSEGFDDFRDWLKAQPESDIKESDSRMRRYFAIFDTVGIMHRIGGSNFEIPTWEGVIENYGADDPIVEGYFEKLEESVRVDAAVLFGSFTSRLRIATAIAPNERAERLAGVLDGFLLDNGYVPDTSSVAVIELQEPEI